MYQFDRAAYEKRMEWYRDARFGMFIHWRERPVFEIMFLNNAIRNMIRESKTHQIDGIIATSQEEGMISMDNSLLALYRQNVISKDTAIIYSSNTELMEKKIARL